MADTIPDITIEDLTSGTVTGTGVFDRLMAASKVHLEQEFNKGRIKGPEYSTVYLGALNTVMGQSLQFLLQKEAVSLQAQLLAQQILVGQIALQKAQIELEMLGIAKLKAGAEVDQIEAQTALITQQKVNLVKDLEKTDTEIAQITAQTAMIGQQKLNLIAEGLNIPKQGQLMDAQVAQATQQIQNLIAEELEIEARTGLTTQQRLNLVSEALNISKQGVLLDKQAVYSTQQSNNLAAEALNIPKQGVILDKQATLADKQVLTAAQQLINLASENLGTIAKTTLTDQQVTNAQAELLNVPKQGELLDAQVCKLKADYDLTVNTNLRTTQEIALTVQKTATEKAQTIATGVDDNSVVGKQKALYQAQTDGFKRDAEQKVAKILVDTWSARRMSDDGTVADGVNMLQDATIGRTIQKLLAGVGA